MHLCNNCKRTWQLFGQHVGYFYVNKVCGVYMLRKQCPRCRTSIRADLRMLRLLTRPVNNPSLRYGKTTVLRGFVAYYLRNQSTYRRNYWYCDLMPKRDALVPYCADLRSTDAYAVAMQA